MEQSERAHKLKEMLEKSPRDSFLLYALAMEYKKQGEGPAAIELLDKVILNEAGYCYAYYQKGQILESLGDLPAARLVYRRGIDAAQVKGDAHAREEIAAALALIQSPAQP
jgi:tetratricopeptide (TPR) repeat protein